jgi:hypothetical protein
MGLSAKMFEVYGVLSLRIGRIHSRTLTLGENRGFCREFPQWTIGTRKSD